MCVGVMCKLGYLDGGVGFRYIRMYYLGVQGPCESLFKGETVVTNLTLKADVKSMRNLKKR